MTVKLG